MAMAMAMVRGIQSLRKGYKSLSRSISSAIPHSSISISISTQSTRTSSTSVSDMRKTAIDDNMRRLLSNEIQYELQRSPLQQPPAEINGFKVSERPGEQWISLEKQFRDSEVIKVEVTMFDGEGEKSGLPGQEIQLNLSMVVTIFKNRSNKVLELICSAWPETVEISNLFVRQRAKVPNQPYTGPKFRELDDELQNSLYEFLEERGIDDYLCIFLHNYVNYKMKAEYIRWMKSVKSVMENTRVASTNTPFKVQI